MKRVNISSFEPIAQEPRGFTKKYWIDSGIHQLIKFNNDLYPDQDIMEKLSCDFLEVLEIPHASVELGTNGIDNCCIVNTFLKEGEVLYEVDYRWAVRETNDVMSDIGISFSKVFTIFENLYDIDKAQLKQIKEQYITLILGDIILGNEDRKLKNVALIFNEESEKYSLAPAFDNALSFHAFNLNGSDPVCYIGNQYFESKDVIQYMLKYHIDIIGSIIQNLQLKMDFFIQILDNYDELDHKKKSYIIQHLKTISSMLVQVAVKER